MLSHPMCACVWPCVCVCVWCVCVCFYKHSVYTLYCGNAYDYQLIHGIFHAIIVPSCEICLFYVRKHLCYLVIRQVLTSIVGVIYVYMNYGPSGNALIILFLLLFFCFETIFRKEIMFSVIKRWNKAIVDKLNIYNIIHETPLGYLVSDLLIPNEFTEINNSNTANKH